MPKQDETRVKDWVRDGFRALFDPDRSLGIPVEGGAGQIKGLPDRYYAAAGGSAWVEAKQGDYRPDPRQCRIMGRLASAGDRVILLRGCVANESVTTHLVEPDQGCYLYLRRKDLRYHSVFTREELSSPAFWTCVLGVRVPG